MKKQKHLNVYRAKLKPCAKCKATPNESIGGGFMGIYFIRCDKCFVETEIFDTMKKAVNAWNNGEVSKK